MHSCLHLGGELRDPGVKEIIALSAHWGWRREGLTEWEDMNIKEHQGFSVWWESRFSQHPVPGTGP